MKNLYTAADIAEVLERIDKINPSVQRQWGKMKPEQMLAHCSAALEVATGQRHAKRMFIGRILGPLFKSQFYNEKPFNKNGPTDPTFLVVDERDLEVERERLKNLVKRFAEGGPSACTQQPHSFFGEMNPQQWSIGMYKHLDHHLRQFGV